MEQLFPGNAEELSSSVRQKLSFLHVGAKAGLGARASGVGSGEYVQDQVMRPYRDVSLPRNGYLSQPHWKGKTEESDVTRLL